MAVHSDEKIEALRKAIASGALRVRMGDSDVWYRSLAEMRETLALMLRENAAAESGAKRFRTVRLVGGTGL